MPNPKSAPVSPGILPRLCCIEAPEGDPPMLYGTEPASKTQKELQFSARPQEEVRLFGGPRGEVKFALDDSLSPPHDISDQVLEFEERLQKSIALIMEQQYVRLSSGVLDILRFGRQQSGDDCNAADEPKLPFPDIAKHKVRLSLSSAITSETSLADSIPSQRSSPKSQIRRTAKSMIDDRRFTVAVQPFQPFVERFRTSMKARSTFAKVTVRGTLASDKSRGTVATNRSSVNSGRQTMTWLPSMNSKWAVAGSKHSMKLPKRYRAADADLGNGNKGCRASLADLLQGAAFGLLSSFLILSYAALIGVETQRVAQDPEENSLTIKVLHYMYSCCFAAELVARFTAYGWSALVGGEGFWNKLDVFFVCSAIVEIIMESATSGIASGANSVVRPVRILRVVRTVRLVRAFGRFHEFQKMAYALLSSMRTLICSMALLVFVMFFFAVWLTLSAADSEARLDDPDLELRYGGLMSTAYTLFLCVSNGISWDLCYMPLHRLNKLASSALILYIAMTLFGVLNVITSIFVESVIRSVQHSRELIVQEKEEEKKIAIQHVMEVFRHIDQDGSGQITTDELEHFLKQPDLRKYLEALDIDAEDTRLLFRLLDRDASGIISAEEFCEGCLRLKGSAKSIDVHAIIFSLKAFLDKWGDFTAYVDESFSKLQSSSPSHSHGTTPRKSPVSQRGTWKHVDVNDR